MGRSSPTRIELEIKLVGCARDVAALREARLFVTRAERAGAWERLVSTYFDTPHGALRAVGVSLRQRTDASGAWQTVKAAAKGEGVVRRIEEERRLLDGAAFPAPVADVEAARVLAPHVGALRPVARTITDRWSTVLRWRKSRIEAAFDIGRIEALNPDGTAAAHGAIAEAELELLDGEASDVFDLARALVDETAGRLNVGGLAKEEQARRLADRSSNLPPDPWFSPSSDDLIGEVLSGALRATASRIAQCRPFVAELRASEGVHQMRVALRRFRAIERIFREGADSASLRTLSKRARQFGAELGAARDWDVFCAVTLPALMGRGEARAMDALRARAEALRASALDRAATVVASARFQRFTLDLMQLGLDDSLRASSELQKRAKKFARRALDERLESAVAMAPALRVDDLAARHPLRIEIKKLRYAAQLFRPLFPGEGRKKYLAALSRLQDSFGEINDAVIAGRLAAEAAEGQGPNASRGAGFIAGFRTSQAAIAARRLDDDWTAFAALNPFWRRAEAAPAPASQLSAQDADQISGEQ